MIFLCNKLLATHCPINLIPNCLLCKKAIYLLFTADFGPAPTKDQNQIGKGAYQTGVVAMRTVLV